MLNVLITAAPAAIFLTALIKVLLLCRRPVSTEPEPQRTSYTVYADSGYANSDNRYDFTLKKLPSGYRCYIDRTPSYRSRPSDAHSTHRLSDSHGCYICFTANLSQVEQARTLCREWSNLTQRYIETGRKFDE